MKIIQIVPTIDNPSDGVAHSVRNLSGVLNAMQQQVELITLDIGADSPVVVDCAVHRFSRCMFFKNFGFSLSMKHTFVEKAKSVHVVHSHSLWMYPNIIPKHVKRYGVKVVTSTHGTLSQYALSRSPLKKKIALLLGQRRELLVSDLLIASCQSEYHDIRRFGLLQPVAIIPNGMELPQTERKFGQKRKLVYLGRIHPIKGVEMLLEAWCRLQDKHPDWELLVAGPVNSDYARQMERMAADSCKRVCFAGELTGQAKWDHLASADCFVLPTRSENFGNVVAESLACGTPVITTKGAPWQGVEEHNAGWWTEVSTEAIQAAMEQAMNTPREELEQMGQRGKEWVANEFSWQRVGQMTLDAYRWLLGECEKPDYIYLD